MKKVIKGKMYNTETAKCVGKWDNGYDRDDLDYVAEKLYRKKTGEYFLYGEGGPGTMYEAWVGNDCVAGHRITPYSEDDAKKWAEESLDGNGYEAIFGPVPE